MSKLILRGIENVELSICIPAYNRVDTLKEAIDSVLNLQQNGIIKANMLHCCMMMTICMMIIYIQYVRYGN